MTRAAFALGVVLCAAALAARAADPSPLPEPKPGRPLVDPDFRVRSGQFGLERQVEMYQWRRDANGYRPVWNAAPIDSTAFADEYRNPPQLPIEGQRWWSEGAMLDGRPLDTEVLRTLGRWREFRPDFARLPANLAASFQPEGNGLGSSENPLAPQVGDLRIRWSELVLGELAGRIELRDGVWRLTPEAAERVVAPAEVAVAVVPDAEIVERWWPWAAGVALLVLVGAVVGGRRSRD